MAQSKFLDNFFEFLHTAGSLTEGILNGESMHYLDLRVGGYDPNKIYKGFYNLRQRELVKSIGQGRYKFTAQGCNWLEKKMKKYFRNRYKKWDHKWRVVIFDIPQEISSARKKFRHRLVTMGFYPIQKSVFVFPYPCEEEVGDIANSLKVDDYIDMFNAEFPGFREKELLKLFDL